MSKKTITICDRCGNKIAGFYVDRSHHQFDIVFNYPGSTCINKIDLCNRCREEFNEFMAVKCEGANGSDDI